MPHAFAWHRGIQASVLVAHTRSQLARQAQAQAGTLLPSRHTQGSRGRQIAPAGNASRVTTLEQEELAELPTARISTLDVIVGKLGFRPMARLDEAGQEEEDGVECDEGSFHGLSGG